MSIIARGFDGENNCCISLYIFIVDNNDDDVHELRVR